MRPSLALAVACVALVGCTTTPASKTDAKPEARGAAKFADDPRLGEEVSQLCFAANIDSFGETTRDTIVIREGRDYYLVEMFPGCSNLRDAQGIVPRAHTSCLTKGDTIIVSDTMMPMRHEPADPFSVQRCSVNAIYKWNPKAAKAEPEKAGETGDATDSKS
ncbi:MAG TPA: DUF6491 family protein [Hyphomonas sp.]|nr:hypothetical protein [Hyphomonas sp.]HPE47117.1 DUF6491 family protein [Hyphomonas sp.]